MRALWLEIKSEVQTTIGEVQTTVVVFSHVQSDLRKIYLCSFLCLCPYLKYKCYHFKHKRGKNKIEKWLDLSTSLLLLTLNLSRHLFIICIKSKCKWLMCIGLEQRQLNVLTLVFTKGGQQLYNSVLDVGFYLLVKQFIT